MDSQAIGLNRIRSSSNQREHLGTGTSKYGAVPYTVCHTVVKAPPDYGLQSTCLTPQSQLYTPVLASSKVQDTYLTRQTDRQTDSDMSEQDTHTEGAHAG